MLVGVAALHAPLTILASNPRAIPHAERVVAISLGVWLVAAILLWALVMMGADPRPTALTLFLGLALIMSGGPFVRTLGRIWGLLLAVMILGVAAYIFYRLAHAKAVMVVAVGLAVALASEPVIEIAQSWTDPTDAVIPVAEPLEIALSGKPDIFLVVLDAYPGLKVFEQDFGLSDRNVIASLVDRDFVVPASAWSPYWMTPLAMSSILELDYPLTSQWRGATSQARLYEKIGGDNVALETLEANGYETYMIESGWSGSNCDPDYYDTCVSSAFVDESLSLVMRKTLFAPWLEQATGGSFAAGTKATMRWLMKHAGAVSRSATPEFVVAHVVAPHPPFYLNRDCDVTTGSGRSSHTFQRKDVAVAERESFFLDQVACVDWFTIALADVIESDDVVIFVGDHGTDRRGQLHDWGSEWSSEAVVERMNVHLAVRLKDGCDLGEELVTTNLLRRVLDCYSEEEIRDVPNRMWINMMFEVDQGLLASLLSQ